MITLTIFVSLLSCATLISSFDDGPYYDVPPTYVWDVEHSFEPNNVDSFKPKGKINVKVGQKIHGFFNPVDKFSDHDMKLLKKCADADGWYKIRVFNESVQVFSQTRARLLIENGLAEVLKLKISNSGRLNGVFIKTPRSSLNEFRTTLEIDSSAPAPVPDTHLYIQKMEEEKAQRAKGGEKDTRSFFSKYWMFIVAAVVVMMVFTNDPNQGQAAGGGGGGGK
ncbi:DgyrCDS5239 [Dimorphilus gyrociliatus]|uniref:ER membrane protein complex subunit 10 n=1 Tax=Dimorphilus gyrociliatus TaxID=2664684 RepID=A0A7I8VKX1_9ANNE|nr:DgyrCDS5239 [Dimorphilus gyrociliatus]